MSEDENVLFCMEKIGELEARVVELELTIQELLLPPQTVFEEMKDEDDIPF